MQYVIFWLFAMNAGADIPSSLTVAYRSAPPFFIEQTALPPTGIVVELTKKLLDAHSIQVQFRVADQANTHNDIQFFSDKIEAQNAGFYVTDSALVTKTAHLLWLEETQAVSNIAELHLQQKTRIAIEPYDELRMLINKAPVDNISIVQAQDAHHAMAMLKRKQVDYLLSFRPSLKFVSIDRRLVPVQSIQVLNRDIYIGVNKNTEQAKALIEKFSSSLVELKTSKEIKAIYSRFTAMPNTTAHSVD